MLTRPWHLKWWTTSSSCVAKRRRFLSTPLCAPVQATNLVGARSSISSGGSGGEIHFQWVALFPLHCSPTRPVLDLLPLVKILLKRWFEVRRGNSTWAVILCSFRRYFFYLSSSLNVYPKIFKWPPPGWFQRKAKPAAAVQRLGDEFSAAHSCCCCCCWEGNYRKWNNCTDFHLPSPLPSGHCCD